MTIAGEYSDEGFSGKNIQGRLEFQRMLNDIESGKDDVQYVLVFKLSRFGRNAADVLNSLQLMQDFGVIETLIAEVQEQIQTIRREQISGDNIYQLLLAFDEIYESATEVERKEFMKAFIT